MTRGSRSVTPKSLRIAAIICASLGTRLVGAAILFFVLFCTYKIRIESDYNLPDSLFSRSVAELNTTTTLIDKEVQNMQKRKVKKIPHPVRNTITKSNR